MDPCQLRFHIFKEAVNLSESEYHAERLLVSTWNSQNMVKMEYPEFPSYEKIQTLAERISAYVYK